MLKLQGRGRVVTTIFICCCFVGLYVTVGPITTILLALICGLIASTFLFLSDKKQQIESTLKNEDPNALIFDISQKLNEITSFHNPKKETLHDVNTMIDIAKQKIDALADPNKKKKLLQKLADTLFADCVKKAHEHHRPFDADDPNNNNPQGMSHQDPSPIETQIKNLRVKISSSDTITAVTQMLQQDKKTAVMILANENHIGGGVFLGAKPQEEAVLRHLDTRKVFQHAIINHGIKLTKYDDPHNPNESHYRPDYATSWRWDACDYVKDLNVKGTKHHVDAMFVAAPYLESTNELDEEARRYATQHGKDQDTLTYIDLMKAKFDNMLSQAKSRGVKQLVLGAVGCGAFNNPPQSVATALKESLQAYSSEDFDCVEIAILVQSNHGTDCSKARDQANVKAFKDVFLKK